MPNMQQAIIWTNDGLVHWRKYALLGLNNKLMPVDLKLGFNVHKLI